MVAPQPAQVLDDDAVDPALFDVADEAVPFEPVHEVRPPVAVVAVLPDDVYVVSALGEILDKGKLVDDRVVCPQRVVADGQTGVRRRPVPPRGVGQSRFRHENTSLTRALHAPGGFSRQVLWMRCASRQENNLHRESAF